MPKIISSKLSSNNKKLNHRTDYFRIKEYIDNFLNGNNQNRFIVMPGLRGVGKTTILLQLYEYLIKNDVPNSDILYFDVSELKSFYDVNILDVITNFIENIHQTTMVELNKPIFLLIDEVHFDKNWALTGKIVYDNNNNIFMIFTGLSAIELQIHADAIRRMEKEQIFPCTFPEYLFSCIYSSRLLLFSHILCDNSFCINKLSIICIYRKRAYFLTKTPLFLKEI